MFDKVQILVEKINKTEFKNFEIDKDFTLIDIDNVLKYLNIRKTETGLEFVHGIGKRKSKLQKWIEKLIEFRDRQAK